MGGMNKSVSSWLRMNHFDGQSTGQASFDEMLGRPDMLVLSKTALSFAGRKRRYFPPLDEIKAR
jgi:hypothetical protein